MSSIKFENAIGSIVEDCGNIVRWFPGNSSPVYLIPDHNKCDND